MWRGDWGLKLMLKSSIIGDWSRLKSLSFFPYRGRGAAGETGPLSEPQRPPLYNGDKSAEPTGSLRPFSDNTGVSLWPCGYCGVVSACMNSGHFLFLINFLVTGQTSKGEEKGPGEKFIVTSAC